MDQELPGGYRLRRYEETASTNSLCHEAAMAGDPGHLWIVARRQTKARGSRGRGWVSYEGNLFASLLMRVPVPPAVMAQLTFVASVAVREALGTLSAEQGSSPQIELKWPNDVLINGCKASGILLESHQNAGTSFVIIGIGVNCCGHPQGTLYPATDLESAGLRVTAPALFDRIAASMEEWIGIWNCGAGFAMVRSTWLQSARGIGAEIVVKLSDDEKVGVFEDIDETGRLVLAMPNGSRERISTADIFILEPGQNGSKG